MKFSYLGIKLIQRIYRLLSLYACLVVIPFCILMIFQTKQFTVVHNYCLKVVKMVHCYHPFFINYQHVHGYSHWTANIFQWTTLVCACLWFGADDWRNKLLFVLVAVLSVLSARECSFVWTVTRMIAASEAGGRLLASSLAFFGNFFNFNVSGAYLGSFTSVHFCVHWVFGSKMKIKEKLRN